MLLHHCLQLHSDSLANKKYFTKLNKRNFCTNNFCPWMWYRVEKIRLNELPLKYIFVSFNFLTRTCEIEKKTEQKFWAIFWPIFFFNYFLMPFVNCFLSSKNSLFKVWLLSFMQSGLQVKKKVENHLPKGRDE